MLYDSNIRAYEDEKFLNSPDCRGIRLELEFLKPELQMERKRVGSTIVVFGSARLKSPEDAEKMLAEAEAAIAQSPDSAAAQTQLRAARNAVDFSKYYTMAREFAGIVTSYDQNETDGFQSVILP